MVLLAVENIPMLVTRVCEYSVFMYEYVTNTASLCKLLVVKSVYINASNANAIKIYLLRE